MSEINKALILSFIEQNYNLTGRLLSADAAYEEFGIPVGHYNAVIKDPQCIAALEEKGVIFERQNDDWTAKSLTPEQLVVANTMLDLTNTMSQKKKLQELGISTQKWNTWLKDPVFKEYLAKRAKQMINENEHEADLAFLDRIRAGDMKALTLYYEMTGQYTPQRANAAQVDVQNVLVKVIEIIIEEVDDRDTADRISNRLRSLVAARNVAGALIGSEDEPIVVPEVVETRAIKA